MTSIKKSLVLLSLLATTGVMAQPMYNNAYANYPYKDGTTGVAPYIGGIVGATNYTASITYDDGSSDSSTQSAGMGYAGTVGVMFNQFIGIEASYLRYGQLSSTYNDGNEVKEYLAGPAADLKGVLPFQNGFNIFGKLGVADLTLHSNVSDDDGVSKSGLDFALGAGYYFTPNVEMTLQYSGTSLSGYANTSLTPSLISFGINIHV
jgi:opacity protein-like surface antigen